LATNGASSEPRPRLEFSGRSRPAILAALASRPLDVLVIGGGINGAGIAREAALRGLSVGLIDKGDFASGTSSRSSKLIHGGLRYLELGDLKLVFSACQERDLLRRRLAPHLVRPLPFLFPVYRGDPHSLAALNAGLWLYDLLATFRNIERHRRLSRRATLGLEPALRPTDLRGAGYYYDCWTDDARLTLETVLSAWREGATVCNYVAVTAFRRAGERIEGVRLHDVLGGEVVDVRASVVVNAAGPWVDAVRLLDDPAARPVLRLTKGVHIVVPRARVGNQHAVVIRAPHDGRVMFVIPWGDDALVGTTDTDYEGSPDAVRADRGDVDYLLEAVNDYFPAARIGVDDVVSAYAGLRPLVVSGVQSNGKAPSAVSREETIVESSHGLISLAGGKLTTHRRAAIAVVERVIAQLRRRGDRRRFPRSHSNRKPLLGAGGQPGASGDALHLTGAGWEHLTGRYGSRAAGLACLLNGQTALREPLAPRGRDLRGEVSIAANAEMAVRVEDVLRRRLHVALKDPSQGMQVAEEVVGLMAEALGWDAERRDAEISEYRARIRQEREGWRRG
jgi:glycerol-3-phosphate dehydrogenase